MFDLQEMCKHNVLISAHRGTWMGNIPANTIMSFNAALRAGADIIELDISKSLDGTLYVFHPKTEPHFLRSEKLISELHDHEVDNLRLVNVDGAFTQYKVPKFDDVLEELKGRCVINIDKFPDCPNEIVACVRKHDMVEQALVKTNQSEQYYRMVEEICPDFQYMTFGHEIDNDSEMLARRKMKYCGCEALFSTPESEFATPEYHEKMHKLGLLTWANAIVFNYQTVHSAGHTDDLYTMGREDEGWGYLAQLGYDIIQTDWVTPCIEYLRANGYRK